MDRLDDSKTTDRLIRDGWIPGAGDLALFADFDVAHDWAGLNLRGWPAWRVAWHSIEDAWVVELTPGSERPAYVCLYVSDEERGEIEWAARKGS